MFKVIVGDLAKRHTLIISLFLSFLSIYSLKDALKFGDNSIFISNSVLSIVLFSMFGYIMYYSIKLMSKRSFIYSTITGLFFSACLILGTQLYLGDNIQISLKTMINIFGVSFIFSSLINILLRKIDWIEGWIIAKDLTHGKSLFIGNRKYFLIIWLILFIAWIPTFLTVYPGIYFFDSVIQLAQCVNGFHLDTSHPILHTLYLYGTFSLGKTLFGNYGAGLALYSISQMLMLSAAYAYYCLILAKYKLPLIFQMFTVLYFALMPINALYAVTSTKDVLFTATLILLVLFTLEIAIDPESFFSKKIYQIRFILIFMLMFLLRNNGVYLFVLCVPVFIFVFRKHWLKMTVLCLITLVSYEVVTGSVYDLLNVQKGDMREALSVPIQQISRAMRDNTNEISKEDKRNIYQIIPKEGIQHYDSRISDPVKSYFKTNVFKKNPIKYIRTWINLGLECPVTYINAFFSTNFGFWYPDMIYPDPNSLHVYMQDSMTELPGNFIHIKRQSLLPGFQVFYKSLIDQTSFQKIPVFSMLFNEGFSFWLLILTGVVSFYRKNRNLYMPFVLLLGLWCTLLLSPVVLLRYAYPIIIAEPLMLAVIFFGDHFKSKQEF